MLLVEHIYLSFNSKSGGYLRLSIAPADAALGEDFYAHIG